MAFLSIAADPWILPNSQALRPGPPPSLGSEPWATAFNEVRLIGARDSDARSAKLTLTARYWVLPDLLSSLRHVAEAPGRKPVDNARMFAMLAMIGDDALQAIVDAKFHCNFWRPITAIRNAEIDGTAGTAADPSWEPLIATPNHPEYPCGHCIIAAATAEYMKSETGNSTAGGIRVASESLPYVPAETLPSWDAWAAQVSQSRVAGGVHFRFSTDAGETMGRKLAQLAIARVMRPLTSRDHLAHALKAKPSKE